MNCYPNPSTSATTIEYYLHQAGQVEIEVKDITGRLLATIENKNANQGKHIVDFDLSPYRSGTYMFTLITNEVSITKKVILQK